MAVAGKNADLEMVRQVAGAGTLRLMVMRVHPNKSIEHVGTYEGVSGAFAQDPHARVYADYGPGYYMFKAWDPGDQKSRPVEWTRGIWQAPPDPGAGPPQAGGIPSVGVPNLPAGWPTSFGGAPSWYGWGGGAAGPAGPREPDFYEGTPWEKVLKMLPPWQMMGLFGGTPGQMPGQQAGAGSSVETRAMQDRMDRLQADLDRERAQAQARAGEDRLRDEFRNLAQQMQQGVDRQVEALKTLLLQQQGGGQSSVLAEAIRSTSTQAIAATEQVKVAAQAGLEAARESARAAHQQDPLAATLIKALMDRDDPAKIAQITQAAAQLAGTGIKMATSAMHAALDGSKSDPPWAQILSTAFERIGDIGEAMVSRQAPGRPSGRKPNGGALAGASAPAGLPAAPPNGASPSAAPPVGDRLGPLAAWVAKLRVRVAAGLGEAEAADFVMALAGLARELGIEESEAPVLELVRTDPAGALAEILPAASEEYRQRLLVECQRIMVEDRREEETAEAEA